MADKEPSSDINIASISVSGIGGLGMVAAAGVVAWQLPELRWVPLIALVGGAAIALTLIAIRHRRERRLALEGLAILAAAVAVGAWMWFR